MKFLEPVEQSVIPRGPLTKYAELYERVLALNGKTLPVEFEDKAAAVKQAHSWMVKSSGCYTRGIRVQKRGNIVYLTKGS